MKKTSQRERDPVMLACLRKLSKKANRIRWSGTTPEQREAATAKARAARSAHAKARREAKAKEGA